MRYIGAEHHRTPAEHTVHTRRQTKVGSDRELNKTQTSGRYETEKDGPFTHQHITDIRMGAEVRQRARNTKGFWHCAFLIIRC